MYLDIREDEPITDVIITDDIGLTLPLDNGTQKILIYNKKDIDMNTFIILTSDIPNLIKGLEKSLELVND